MNGKYRNEVTKGASRVEEQTHHRCINDSKQSFIN